MNKVFVVLGLVAMAGTAMGQITATSQPIDSIVFGERSNLVAVYTGISGPYSAFGSAPGLAGIDDYDSIDPYPTMILGSLRFVGGVATAGDVMLFEFLDTNAVVQNNFSIALPVGGANSIWTITLGGNGGKDSTFVIPSDGAMRITTTSGAGRWWFTTTAPTIGANDMSVLGGSTLNPIRNHAFDLNAVPTPGALALLGLGGLCAARRRR